MASTGPAKLFDFQQLAVLPGVGDNIADGPVDELFRAESWALSLGVMAAGIAMVLFTAAAAGLRDSWPRLRPAA